MCVLVKRNLYNSASKGITINVIFYEWQKRRGKRKYKQNTPTQRQYIYVCVCVCVSIYIYIYIYIWEGSKNYGVYY